jgi:hypothetical protein
MKVIVQGPSTQVGVGYAKIQLLSIGVVGPPGPAGPGGNVYEHVQSSPSAQWVVNHNLGVNTIVAVLSPGGLVVEADVAHQNINQVHVNFNQPQTGKAIAR